MKVDRIPIATIKTYPALVEEYLEQESTNNALFPDKFSIDSFSDKINNKAFSNQSREVLYSSLKEQYLEAAIDLNDVTNKQLESLREGRTYTITTGHQLSLFTGPLFFILKILQTIKLADILNKRYPSNHFVPIFWMATEDHDFEEINHIHLFGKRLQWNAQQKGMVGDFNVATIDEIILPLIESLGESTAAQELKNIFESSYEESANLAVATRRLVHKLFGARGLIIIDGNSKALKNSFVDSFRSEIENETLHVNVSETIKGFSNNHKVQVKPRKINLFYLQKGSRQLIIKEKNVFELKDGSKKWTQDELLNEISDSPERFSPNVILRPMFQEAILPNLCYIGGPAEIAYWLELKSSFKAFNIEMPFLNLRNSLMWLDSGKLKKIEKLGFDVQDLFADENEINKKLADFESTDQSIETDIEKINSSISDLAKDMERIDASLKPVVLAEGKRIEKQLQQLKARLLKSKKAKNEQRINAFWNLYEKVFPGGNLHERYDNFVPYFLNYGWSFFDHIYEHIDPEDNRLLLIKDM